MKLKFFLMATAAMTLATSCSSDAVVEDQQAANAIQFGVTTGSASRAASYYCNNNKPTQFNVWAATDGKTYFEGESFSQKGGTGNWTIDGDFARFWPSTEVSFFAVKNNTKYGEGAQSFATVNWDNTKLVPTIDIEVPNSAKNQQDLLYAYTKATKKAETVTDNKCVANLNFRHALSQVVFKAQNKNKNIYVQISEVQVANLLTKGTFEFPTTVTDQNLTAHKQDEALPTTGIGSWKKESLSTPAAVTTTEKFSTVNVPGDSKVVNLTDNNDKDNVDNSLIVLPQTLDAATINSTKKPGTTGAYFKVLCTIWNVSGTSFDESKDVKLYDNEYIYIPVNVAWEVGKKYIYTFVFSEKGHAGYDEEGNDVLIPIEFNVTVDDFAKAQEGFNGTVDADNGN